MPHIVLNGAEWYYDLGLGECSGTKLFSISGDVGKPGVYELPMGTPLGDLLELAGAEDVQAVQVGGASGTTVPASDLNRALSFKDLSLVGILSGLLRSENPFVFVIGCDMPFVSKKLIRHIASKITAGTGVVVPVVRGFYEPLCVVYSRSTSRIIEKYLDSGGTKVTGFFEFASVAEVGETETRIFDPRLESFINLNTPRDYENYRFARL